MKKTTEVRVPNIGDYAEVVVIEVLVSAGSVIKKEDPLLTLESDKATMDIPSPCDGVVTAVFVSEGDTVSENTLIMTVEQEMADADQTAGEKPEDTLLETPAAETVAQAEMTPKSTADRHGEVVVLGGGPGGYTAAFRAADLGKQTIIIENTPQIGGVCLNVGCIPSKVLLHMAKIIDEALEAKKLGIGFQAPDLNVEKMQDWKNDVIAQLVGGLTKMASQRKITVVRGTGTFLSPTEIKVTGEDPDQVISFEHAIIAAGSHPIMIPGFPEDARIVDSTGALSLREIPKRMLIIGGGIIGLEMATVYHALGSEITVVEAREQLIPGADADLIKPLQTFVQRRFKQILLETSVVSLSPEDSGIQAVFKGKQALEPQEYDIVLVAVGRRPSSKGLALEK
ncbi:MAG: FAD-dependent oxidoreductase, partial [bacterium]